MDDTAVERGRSDAPFLPWWAGGLALAGVLLAAVALVKPLGVSTQYVRAVGGACSLVDPSVCETNAYFKEEGVKFGYEEMVVLGILPGALLAGLATRRRRRGAGGEGAWRSLSGPARRNRLATAFVGGVLLLFGARLAGGCTSGHILSGVSQMAVSSTLFAAAAFGSAVLVARSFRSGGAAGGAS